MVAPSAGARRARADGAESASSAPLRARYLNAREPREARPPRATATDEGQTLPLGVLSEVWSERSTLGVYERAVLTVLVLLADNGSGWVGTQFRVVLMAMSAASESSFARATRKLLKRGLVTRAPTYDTQSREQGATDYTLTREWSGLYTGEPRVYQTRRPDVARAARPRASRRRGVPACQTRFSAVPDLPPENTHLPRACAGVSDTTADPAEMRAPRPVALARPSPAAAVPRPAEAPPRPVAAVPRSAEVPAPSGAAGAVLALLEGSPALRPLASVEMAQRWAEVRRPDAAPSSPPVEVELVLRGLGELAALAGDRAAVGRPFQLEELVALGRKYIQGARRPVALVTARQPAGSYRPPGHGGERPADAVPRVGKDGRELPADYDPRGAAEAVRRERAHAQRKAAERSAEVAAVRTMGEHVPELGAMSGAPRAGAARYGATPPPPEWLAFMAADGERKAKRAELLRLASIEDVRRQRDEWFSSESWPEESAEKRAYLEQRRAERCGAES